MVSVARSEAGGPPPTADAPDVSHMHTAVRRDLMRVHSKKMALVLIAIAIGMLVGSLDYGVRGGLPSVALDWLFGLQVLRAAVAFVIVAILLMLLLRGWGGLWPERILTTGVEFPSAEKDVEEGAAESAKISRALLSEIKAMTTESRE
jgi:hypothetical protein